MGQGRGEGEEGGRGGGGGGGREEGGRVGRGRREGGRGGKGGGRVKLMVNTNVPYLVMKEVVRGLEGLCAPSSGITEYLHCVCVSGCERESV